MHIHIVYLMTTTMYAQQTSIPATLPLWFVEFCVSDPKPEGRVDTLSSATTWSLCLRKNCIGNAQLALYHQEVNLIQHLLAKLLSCT